VETPVFITSFSSFSPLGDNPASVWENYLNDQPLISEKEIDGKKQIICSLPEELIQKKETLRQSDKYKNLDNSVLYAILASRKAVEKAGWKESDIFGINIGSSRGATSLFEKFHQEFIETGKTSTLASPTTTLGNISSWVAQDLKNKGIEISHSIACSTAFHALLNGIAWINSGMTDKFLVGGSEAPLTPFTIAQMKALKIYAREFSKFPCRALDLKKTQSTMVLGEGAAVVCLEKTQTPNTIAKITGIGYATEILQHGVSITEDAECLQSSMKMALKNTDTSSVDVIVMHAPGTIKGDLSEVRAIKKIFGKTLPMLTTNKWKIGHTFGASGTLSLELALLMLKHQKFIRVPFIETKIHERPLRKILINTVGFGGNAVSVLIEKV